MQPGLRAPEDAAAFVARWDETARTPGASRRDEIARDFQRNAPYRGSADLQRFTPAGSADRLLHARLQGNTLGVFDVIYDSTAAEQVEAGQAKTKDGTVYYDVWTSFSAGIPARGRPAVAQTLPTETESREDPISLRSYIINAAGKAPERTRCGSES